MSFVGEPFAHDVFVSYAHAERETDDTLIRDWSQRLASKLRTLLASALNPTVDDGSRFDMFLDDRSLNAGDDLTRQAARPRRAFRDPAGADEPALPEEELVPRRAALVPRPCRQGRPRPRALLPVRIQPLQEAAWPDRLRDERGALPVYLDLADAETGLPLDDLDAPCRPRTCVRKALIQIKGRLEDLRRRLQARRAIERPTSLDRQIVYLHAHPEDRDAWDGGRRTARRVRRWCCPTSCRHYPATMPCCSDSARRGLRNCASARRCSCCAPASSETFRFELMAFYTDLQRLYQSTQRRLPWAIVDRVGGPLPLADRFRVPRLTADDWHQQVRELIRPARGAP